MTRRAGLLVHEWHDPTPPEEWGEGWRNGEAKININKILGGVISLFIYQFSFYYSLCEFLLLFIYALSFASYDLFC